eukprot:ANDGO_08353.mRNA.1 hypothetical protein
MGTECQLPALGASVLLACFSFILLVLGCNRRENHSDSVSKPVTLEYGGKTYIGGWPSVNSDMQIATACLGLAVSALSIAFRQRIRIETLFALCVVSLCAFAVGLAACILDAQEVQSAMDDCKKNSAATNCENSEYVYVAVSDIFVAFLSFCVAALFAAEVGRKQDEKVAPQNTHSKLECPDGVAPTVDQPSVHTRLPSNLVVQAVTSAPAAMGGQTAHHGQSGQQHADGTKKQESVVAPVGAPGGDTPEKKTPQFADPVLEAPSQAVATQDLPPQNPQQEVMQPAQNANVVESVLTEEPAAADSSSERTLPAESRAPLQRTAECDVTSSRPSFASENGSVSQLLPRLASKSSMSPTPEDASSAGATPRSAEREVSGIPPSLQGVTPSLGAVLRSGEEGRKGVLVVDSLQGQSAMQAFIADGDYITHIAGQSVENRSDVNLILANYNPGDVVDVAVLRGTGLGEEVSQLEIGGQGLSLLQVRKFREQAGMPVCPRPLWTTESALAAITILRPWTGFLCKHIGSELQITAIAEESPAARAKPALEKGMVVVAIDRKKVDSLQLLESELSTKAAGEVVVFECRRSGASQTSFFSQVELGVEGRSVSEIRCLRELAGFKAVSQTGRS